MNESVGPKGRVLVIDGEASAADDYRRSLVEAGYRVAEARDGVAALKKVAAETFDLVLMDCALPNVAGTDLLRGLRARSPRIPLILLRNAGDEDLALPGMEEGPVQWLVKPIDARMLERAVESAVRLSHRGAFATFRNRRGERVEPSLLSGTDAKNKFGQLLEEVIQGGVVVVTKHDAPKAVIISLEEFDALSRGATRELDTLASDFDALLERMQTPAARAGMQSAFDASPDDLGQAAVRAARRRG